MSDSAEIVAARLHQMADRERELLAQATKAVLGTLHGRRLLWWLLGETGLYSSSYRRDPTGRGDAVESAFREGMRNIGVILDNRLCSVDPDAVILMQTEALKAKRDERAEREAVKIDDARREGR